MARRNPRRLRRFRTLLIVMGAAAGLFLLGAAAAYL